MRRGPDSWQIDLADPRAFEGPLAEAESLQGVVHLASLSATEPSSLDELRAAQAQLIGGTLHLVGNTVRECHSCARTSLRPDRYTLLDDAFSVQSCEKYGDVIM